MLVTGEAATGGMGEVDMEVGASAVEASAAVVGILAVLAGAALVEAAQDEIGETTTY